MFFAPRNAKELKCIVAAGEGIRNSIVVEKGNERDI
jgi:hypothetical protein